MPGFQELQNRNPEIVVAAITNSPQSNVEAVMDRLKLQELNVAISHNLSRTLKITSQPTTVVIDPSGRIRFIHNSALPDVVGYVEKDLAYLKAEKDK